MTVRGAVASLAQSVRDKLDPVAAKQRQEAEREREFRAYERRTDLRWLLANPQGRRIAANLLTRCHLMANAPDPKAEGRRELGLALFGELVGASPEEALELFRMDPAFQRAVEAAKPKDAEKT